MKQPKFYPVRLLLIVLILVLLIGAPAHTGAALRQQAERAGEHIIADTGFRPAANGFSFQNYGNKADIQNLTPQEMREIFGDQVCASLKGGTCLLTPPAQKKLEEFNRIMANGHCDGMAALSLLMYQDKVKTGNFGADAVSALKFKDNPRLQREIARWFATQLVNPTLASKLKFIQDNTTPNQIVDLLVKAMTDKSETYTIAFFKRGYHDGHAVTPYEIVDMGGGIYHVMIYDNNFPDQERFIEVNRAANTWKYIASVNPDAPQALYEGDATSKTLLLVPTSARTQQQRCEFCQASTAKGQATAAPTTEPDYNEIWLTTNGDVNQLDLLITDDQGHRLGYQGGEFYDEIPSALFNPVTSDDLWNDDPEPVYLLPTGIGFTITVDGSAAQEVQVASVAMIGPGYDLSIDNINVQPGEKETFKFSPDGTRLSYTPSSAEAPDFSLGLESSGADYSFDLNNFDLDAGSTINLALEFDKGRLSVNIAGGTQSAIYGLEIERIDNQTDAIFTNEDVELPPDSTAYVNFAAWDGKGDLAIGIDEGSNGSIDQTVQEPNIAPPLGISYYQTATSGTFTAESDGSYTLKLADVAPNTVYMASNAPLAVSQIKTAAFAQSWKAGASSAAAAAVIELDQVSVYAELSAPVYDAADHTLTYKATLNDVLPVGSSSEGQADAPATFGIANILISENAALLTALTNGAKAESITLNTGGQPNIATGGQPNIATGGQPNIATGGQPNIATGTGGTSVISYYQTAASGTLTATDAKHSTLTLNEVYPISLAASVTPPLGLVWLNTNSFSKIWRAGGSGVSADAVLQLADRRVYLHVSDPVSDAAKHTLTYTATAIGAETLGANPEKADVPTTFGAADLLISRDAALTAALTLGVNTEQGSLTSGGQPNIATGTSKSCQEALGALSDAFKGTVKSGQAPDAEQNARLSSLDEDVGAACTASSANLTPAVRHTEAASPDVTQKPPRR